MTSTHRQPSRFDRRMFITATAGIAVGASFAQSTAAQTPFADELVPFAERVGSLLAKAPARALSGETPLPFYYADLAKQIASVGVELPDAEADLDSLSVEFTRAYYALPLAAQAFQVGLMEDWFETFGFQPYGVEQAITFNIPPNITSIFAGSFDVERIESTLDGSGYQRLEQEIGGTYWTVGDELDLDSPVGRLGLGMMNHAAIHEDALVFAQQEDDLQDVTHTIGGYVPSMLEEGVWPGMIKLFSPDTVGLIPLSPVMLGGGFLPTPGEATPAASPVALAAIEVEYLAFGVRAGAISEPLSLVGEGTPEATPVSGAGAVPAHVEARIRYGDAAAAAREAEAIADRWTELASPLTGQPYAELMRLEDSYVHEEDSQAVALEFVSDVPNRWIQMIQTQDLAPFVPAMG